MNLDHRIIYAIHIFAVAPLLWHVSHNRYTADDRLFTLLKVLSVLIVLHHGFMLYKTTSSKDNFNELNNYISDNEFDSDDDQ